MMNELDNNSLNGMEPLTTPVVKKKKGKFIIGGLLLVVAVAIGLFIGYKKLNADPVSVYKSAINEVYKNLNEALEETENIEVPEFDVEKPFELGINVTLESSMEELKNFSGLNYNVNVGLDYSKKLANVNLGIRENNTSLISLLISAVDKEMYLKSDDLLDKVISLGEYDIFSEMNLEEFNTEDININYDDLKYILAEMKSIIIDSLDKEKFTTEEETIKFDNKDYNTKKVIYTLDSENLERTNKYINDRILKDEKLLKAIAEVAGITTDEVKEELEATNDYSNNETINIIIYTDKLNNIIAGKLYVGDEEKIKFDTAGDTLNISIEDDNTKITLDEANNYYELKINDDGSEIIYLKLYKVEEALKADYKVIIEGTTYSGGLEISNIKNTNTENSCDFKFSIEANLLGETLDIAIEGDLSIAQKEITKIDTSNSVKLEELTDEDMMNIYTKLESVLNKLGLSDLLTM